MDSNQNSNGMMNGIPPVAQPEKKIGPIVGVLVIVLILIIVALYFFGHKLNTTPTVQEQTPVVQEIVNIDNTANVSSTDSAVLEADLDEQLQDIDYSF